MLPPNEPLLAPAVRHRLREKFPELEDADLPLFAISESELVDRIARRTAQDPAAIRRVLQEIGVFVPRRVATQPLRSPSRPEESMGSGVPDDTAQSGAMGMGPGW